MEVHAAQLARGLAARGHAVTVLTTAHPDGRAEAVIDGASHVFLAGTKPGAYSPEWWSRSVSWVRAQPPFDAMLAESGAAESVLKARLGVPLVAVCHGLSGWTLEGMWRGLGTTTTWRGVTKMALTWLREQLQFSIRTHQYDRVVCVSEPLVHAVRTQWHYAADRVVCIPNGIDISRFIEASKDETLRATRRSELGLAPGDVAILVSGRLEPDKGVHLALEAIRRLPPRARLIVAGAGSARGALDAQIRELGIGDRVHLLGHRPVAEMPALHAASDIYLFPTLLSESFGFGALEAMAAGKPVVAPPVGGLPMLVEHGKTGLAFPVGSADGIEESCRRLIEEPALASQLGQEGQRAAGRYTEEAMILSFEALMLAVRR